MTHARATVAHHHQDRAHPYKSGMVTELLEYPVRMRLAKLTTLSDPTDFRLGEGYPVPLSRMYDADVSPYCFDFGAGNLICVATPDISRETFFYQAQRQYAQAVISVPFDLLPPAPAAPILLFSVGRCGSTLLQKALALARLRTVGEPDFTTQVSMPAYRDKISKTLLKRVIGGAVALLPYELIKLRAECNNAPLLLAGSFSAPRVMFILRKPEDWAASVHRFSNNTMPPQQLAAALRHFLFSLDTLTQCHDVRILHYEDFRDLSAPYVNDLLAWLGEEARVDEASVAELASLDSQEGTLISRVAMRQIPENPSFRGAFRDIWAQLRPAQLIERHGLKWH